MPRLLQTVILTSSALLAIAFISYRSGVFSGTVSQASAPPTTPATPSTSPAANAAAPAPTSATPDQHLMLSGSKSGVIFIEPTITTTTQPTILLGGSKSKAILTPEDAAKLKPQPAPAPPPAAIMSSSKYDIIVNPTASPPATQPAPPKTIFSSSKVIILTDPVQLIPATQPASK